VFDPERDEEHDTRRFYVRLLTLFAVSSWLRVADRR